MENFLTQAVSLHGVTEYNGAPCPKFGHACQNSAQCIAVLNDYECKCMTGYTGRHCERSESNICRYKFRSDHVMLYICFIFHLRFKKIDLSISRSYI